jgi:hypothetical protein
MPSGYGIRPTPVTLASALSLAATYGNVGSAPKRIAGATDINLKLAEVVNTENAVVKFYVSANKTAPASVASMYQVTAAAGTETEVVITQNTAQMFALPISGEYFWMQGKGATGTNADLTASLIANYAYDPDGFKWQSAKKTFGSVATAIGGSATQVGSVLDIRGLGNITLFVTESGGTNGVITVYLATGATAPADTTTMTALKNATPAAVTFTTLANEKACHWLGNLCADYMALTATGNTAALQVDLYGTLSGVRPQR